MLSGQMFQYKRDIAVRTRSLQATRARAAVAGTSTIVNKSQHLSTVKVQQPATPAISAVVITLPEQEQHAPPGPASLPPPLNDADEHKRRECITASLEDTMGWKERGQHFYLRGCNFKTIIDLEAWADETGCGTAPLAGPL